MARPYEGILILLSFSRVALGLVFIIVFTAHDFGNAIIALSIIVIAQVTDHLDGWVARKFSKPSRSGYLQDSVADKAFQLAVLLALTREYQLQISMVWLVMLREITVLAIRIQRPFTHEQMQQLRPHSIAFAFLLRGGCVGLVFLLLLSEWAWIDTDTGAMIFTAVIYLAIVPSVTVLRDTFEPSFLPVQRSLPPQA